MIKELKNKLEVSRKTFKPRGRMVADIRTHFYAFDIVKRKIKENIGRSRLTSLSDPFSHLKLNLEN